MWYFKERRIPPLLPPHPSSLAAAVHDCLFSIFTVNPNFWGPFGYPQPADVLGSSSSLLSASSLKKPFRLHSRTFKDAQDRPIGYTDEIKERWRGYTESVYTKDQTIQAEWLVIPSTVVDPVHTVLPAEVTTTIRHINNNKAPGSDDLNIELIKAINDDSNMMAQLSYLCNQIITEGKWPAEFRGSIYVPIYTKGDKMDCKNYRTIALIPHASKIVLGIIHQRMLRLKQASGKTTEPVTKS